MATIGQRLSAAISAWRGGAGDGDIIESKAAPFVIWPDYVNGVAQWRLIDLTSYIEEGFSANAVIYSAIMYKARASNAAPLRAYTGDPDADERERLPSSHPLAQLVARPNKSQSWFEFQMAQTIFFNTAGECITWFDRRNSERSVPSAAYPLPPQRVMIIPNPGGKKGILGYVYVPEGKAWTQGVPLLPQDVSHIKLPNPLDPLDGDGYGLSPISPMARSADVDNIITKFLGMFMRRGAIPPGVLSFEGALDDATIARIKQRWKDQYGGYEKWSSEVGVLERGGKFERVGFTFEELGFGELDERSETRMTGPLGVPPILIGTRVGLLRGTYSNYEQARQAFWEDTYVPELGLFQDDFQYYMQSDDGGFVAYDLSKVPALQNVLAKRAGVHRDAWNSSGITRNEYRARIGEPPTADGDVYKVDPNAVFVPAGQQAAQAPAALPEATEDAETEKVKAIKELTVELREARKELATK